MNYKKLGLISVVSMVMVSGIMLFGVQATHAANTWYVDPAGNDSNACTASGPTIACASLPGAIAKASSGDTIMVAAGTYTIAGVVNVNKTLNIKGSQAGIDARTRSASESILENSGGLYVTANNVVVDGFTVQDSVATAFTGYGIDLGAGTSGAQIVNNIIQNNIVGLGLANKNGGNQAVIQYNLFRTNNQSGAASGTGIYSDIYVGGAVVANVLINKNKFIGQNDSGVDFSGGGGAPGSTTNITISSNEFDSNGRAFFLLDTTSSSITLNNIHNSTESLTADIRIFGGVSGLSITCNTLQNGSGRAMRINDGNGGDPSSNISVNYNNISNYPIGMVVDSGSYMGGAGSLNAKNDWWASATGPTTAANPGGTGVTIVDPDGVVDFTPWLTSTQGLPCPTPPFTNRKQCHDAAEQSEKNFNDQQKADKKNFDDQQKSAKQAFEATHPTPAQRKTFEDQQKSDKKNFEDSQKAAKDSFEMQYKAQEQQCETLPN
jgi:hypothetical protein